MSRKFDSEFEFHRNIRLGIFAALVVLLASIGSCTFTHNTALNRGLCQAQNIGTDGYHWVPCGK